MSSPSFTFTFSGSVTMIGEYKVVVDTVVVDVDVEDVVVVGIVDDLCLHPFRTWTINMILGDLHVNKFSFT